MKKALVVILALALMLALAGCSLLAQFPQNQTEQEEGQPQSGEAAQTETGKTEPKGGKPEAAPELAHTWRLELDTKTYEAEFFADDGTRMMSFRYEVPQLVLVDENGAVYADDGTAADADLLALRDAFNSAFAEYEVDENGTYQAVEDARAWYQELGEEYRDSFAASYEEMDVVDVFKTETMISVHALESVYYGGAHPGAIHHMWHFDLQEGEFVTVRDMADYPGQLLAAIGGEIFDQIDANDLSEWYFEDYVETIQAKEDYDVVFRADGMTVYFTEYEIAPYASGIPSFDMSYDVIEPFLNARGMRLLGFELAQDTEQAG